MPKKNTEEMVDLHIRMPKSLKDSVQHPERGAEWIRKTLQGAVDAEKEQSTIDQVLAELREVKARLDRLEEQ